MKVRPATVGDLDLCEELDASYLTNYAWQMSETTRSDRVGATFQRVRLPRQMGVKYPCKVDDLLEDWRRSECLLVACEGRELVGYLDMIVESRGWQGWIKHLVVHRAWRRQGVATRLLEVAEDWARSSRLYAVTAVVQNKNDPAINLCINRGYAFRGFIDYYFNNGDLGLLYSLRFSP